MTKIPITLVIELDMETVAKPKALRPPKNKSLK